LGPIGADGSRPLLGQRGGGAGAGGAGAPSTASGCPTARVPGASVAAEAEAARQARARGSHAGSASAAVPEGGGYSLVQPRRGVALNPVGAAAVAADSPPTRGPPVVTSNSWAALADDDHGDGDDPLETGGAGGGDSDVDICGGDDGAQADDDAEDAEVVEDADQGGDGGGPSEGELKRVWLSHCNSCRLLERDGGTQPALLCAAREQRDRAERAWRAAKQPHPLHKRLRWAEGELREAEAKEEGHRRELSAHLEQAARRTAELEARVATDVARTARKREALARLLSEGNTRPCPAAERAARIAVTGIRELAPALSSVIEHMGDDAAEMRQELQLVSVALGRVEGVLLEATETAAAGRTPTHFDISDATTGARDGGGDDGGTAVAAEAAAANDYGRATAEGATARPPAAAAPRWTKTEGNGQWKRRIVSAAEAAEAARSMLQRRGATTGTTTSSASGGGGGGAATAAAAVLSSAATNDLAEAERRAREASQLQTQQALEQQQRQQTLEQQQLGEQQRIQREARRQEEMLRHQLALQQAAAARAAEEAKQREELIAKLSPEERARAEALHAQNAAVGAAAFGTQAASHLAGLAHQSHVQHLAHATAGEDDEAHVHHLMSLSPEELADYEQGQQARGEVPW
jgi:hypothetical protein